MNLEVKCRSVATEEMMKEVSKVIHQASKEWRPPSQGDSISIVVKDKQGVYRYIHYVVIMISYKHDAVLYVVDVKLM